VASEVKKQLEHECRRVFVVMPLRIDPAMSADRAAWQCRNSSAVVASDSRYRIEFTISLMLLAMLTVFSRLLITILFESSRFHSGASNIVFAKFWGDISISISDIAEKKQYRFI
jgi:hypothetical protein